MKKWGLMDELRELHLRGATGTVRMASWNGTEHLVVPVVALMEGVIHAINADVPEYVPLETLSQTPHMWNNRPAVLKHPTKDGKQISANSPTVLESQGLGSVFGTQIKDKKLIMEAFIDPVKATKLGAGDMIKRLRAGETVEVSVGAYVVTEPRAGEHNGKPYKAIWKQIHPDHLAFLPEGIGACSVKMGCGTRAAEAYLVTAEGFEVLGGPGSGYYGHGGRPGEVGGSGPGGTTNKKIGDVRPGDTVHNVLGTPIIHVTSVDSARAPGYKIFQGTAATTQRGDGQHLNPGDRMSYAAGHKSGEVFTSTDHPDHPLSPTDSSRRSKEGHGGTKTPKVGDKVKVASPHIHGFGKTGEVTSSDRDKSFHVVKHSDGSHASYHSSDLKVRGAESLGERVLSFFRGLRSDDLASDDLTQAAELVDDLDVDFSPIDGEEAKDYEGKWAEVAPKVLADKTGGDHPFTYCMGNIIPAMERDGKAPGDPEAFCGWWKAEHAEAYFGEGIKAAGEKPCGCSGGTMTNEVKSAAIKLITETKGTGFGPDDIKTLEAWPDKMIDNLKILTESKIAADKATADAAEEKRQAELKAAAEKVPTYEEWSKTAPPEVRTLVDKYRQLDATKKKELIAVLKTAQAAYTEKELEAMDVDQLERLALVAKVDYSGKGTPMARHAEDKDDVFLNPPDPYAIALKARAEQEKVQ